jgi:hypothetical protein
MLENNKNLLINGNKYYAQRAPAGGGGTFTPTTSYQYLTVDRFCQKITGTITSPLVGASATFPDTKSPWCSIWTGTTAVGSSISEQQRIEADFGLELIGDYISFLGFVTSTSYSKATINIGYATVKDNHAVQTLLYTKDFTITTDGVANTLTWNKIASLSSLISTGLYCEIVLSTPTNTATSSTHRIGGMNLVRGRNATTANILAARSLVDELEYCQRYYRQISVPAGNIAGLTGMCQNTTYAYFSVPIGLRATAIVTFSGGLQLILGNSSLAITGVVGTLNCNYLITFGLTVASGLVAAQSVALFASATTGYLHFTSEL